MISFSTFIFKKLGVAAASVFKKILEKVQKFCEFFVKYWWLIIVLVVIVLIGLAILVFTVNRNNLGKCIEQGESSLTNNTNFVSVLAYPNDNSFFEVQENNYEHEKDSGKMNALSTLLDGTSIKKNNSSPIIIEITGSWIPWFGDLVTKDNSGRITDTFQRDIATPNKTELCRFRKKTLGSDKFNGTLQAREYYYLENYYKDVDFTKIGANTTLEADTKILDPVLQEPCWIEGGTGLYLGFYGVDGNGFPSHFHHLQANEMVCDPENFLRNYNYSTQNTTKTRAITTFDFGYNDFYNGGDYKKIQGITYGDYIYQNFSLNYAQARQKAYENCKNGTDIKTCIDKIIEEEKEKFIKTKEKYFLSYKDGYIVYNIRQHEEAMMNANIKDYPQLITKAQQAFKDACYYIKKTDNNQGYNVIDAAKYRFREYFDENRLLADYENNINYKNKEVGKILLLDKYYSDNQGGYSLDFKSGFIVDTTSDKVSISSKFKDIEQFLLGTSKPHEDDDRTDGFIYKVYQNILDSGFETIAKAALALFVAIKGLYVILGFAEMKRKDLILFCIRIAFLFSIVDSNGWAFYNKTFINYFVNAVIGFVDLMAQIFNSVYDLVLPSSMVNNSMKIFEKTATMTNTYEIWQYLTVFDNIFDFLKDPTLHKRIVSLIFVKGNPAIGIIMFLMSYFMLYKFIKAVITSIVPLIVIIAQIAILLPLAPIFLVFMFFQRTETYFKNWVKNMASRSFELIVFFFVLFTTTGLINGKIQEFYSFKVCYRHLYSAKNDTSAFKTQSDLIEINKSKSNWMLESVQNVVKFVFKTLFGQIIVPIPVGLSNISLLAILLNFLVLYFLIFMYSTINSSITQLMAKIFSFKDPQDKNDKGKFENAGSGLVGDKHNKLTYNVFDRLADMGGKGIIEGASSIFSTDKNGKHTPRISTNNSFLKNIGGIFKMGKDVADKTINFADMVSGGTIFNKQRKLNDYHKTSPVSKFLQHNQQRLGNFINRFEKFVTTGDYLEFKKGNHIASVKHNIFKKEQKFVREENKLLKEHKILKKKNLTQEERNVALENIRIARETLNNLAASAATLYKKSDYSKNKSLSFFKRIGANWKLNKEINDENKSIRRIIDSITNFNKQEIETLKTISRIKKEYGSSDTKQKVIIDTGLTVQFIKEINEKVKEANKLFKQGQTEDFVKAIASINDKFLSRDTEAFINKITKAQEKLIKNKIANNSTKTGLADRLYIYTKLQENLVKQIKKDEKLDLTVENNLLDTFKKIDKKTTPTIDLLNLISENKFNSSKRAKITRANIWNMAQQQLASDLIENGTINEKIIDRFNYITKKANKVYYTRKSDTFREITAIQTALTIDNNYVKELNELNKKLKERNISETKKTEINDRITKIQEIRQNSALVITINESQEKYGKEIEKLNKKLDNENIKLTERHEIKKEIRELQKLRDNFERTTIVDKIKDSDRTFERQEILLNKLEAYKSQTITEQRIANTDRIISDLENKLNEKDITKEDRKKIEKQKERVKSIKKELEKIEKQTPTNDRFEKQEILLNKLETEFGKNSQIAKISSANIEKEIDKTKERLNIIKALKEQSSDEATTLYERLIKPLEVQATQTEVMLGINSRKTRDAKTIVKDRINTLKKELKTTKNEVTKAEIKKEIDLLENKDIDKLSKFYDIKDKFTERKIVTQLDHIERVKEANGDENKLQNAKELLKTQEDLLTTQEKLELLRNGDTDILRTKLSNELKTETDKIRKDKFEEQIDIMKSKGKDGLQSLEQTLKTQEKTLERKVETQKREIEIYNEKANYNDRINELKQELEHENNTETRQQLDTKIKQLEITRDNIIKNKQEISEAKEFRDLIKDNEVETVKERLEKRKAELDDEARKATPERKKEIETQKAEIQNDLNTIYKSERGEITNEQLQEHFERKEKVADRKNEILKYRENKDLIKENKIEIVKERLEYRKIELDDEARKAIPERKEEIETKKTEIQNDLNVIDKLEKDVKEGRITAEQSSEQMQEHFERKEKVADKTVEVYKSRENKDLIKENKIEIVKERLENEKTTLNREAKTATDERRSEIDARRTKVQNDLNIIDKLEKDVKEGRITTEQSNEQLQKHFETNEKFANTEINTMNLEKVINNLPERERDALNGVVNALNQQITEINTNPEEFLTKEKAISELKERAIDIIKETVKEKNQFDVDTILADNFSMENFAPGTQAEAFTIKLDETAFIISTDAKSFNIVVNDNLYPCQVTEEGAIEVDPMAEQLKESFTVLKKANDFNIKMLEYQLAKAKEDNSSVKKQNDINEQLEKAKVKNKRYEKQLNKKVGQQK